MLKFWSKSLCQSSGEFCLQIISVSTCNKSRHPEDVSSNLLRNKGLRRCDNPQDHHLSNASCENLKKCILSYLFVHLSTFLAVCLSLSLSLYFSVYMVRLSFTAGGLKDDTEYRKIIFFLQLFPTMWTEFLWLSMVLI